MPSLGCLKKANTRGHTRTGQAELSGLQRLKEELGWMEGRVGMRRCHADEQMIGAMPMIGCPSLAHSYPGCQMTIPYKNPVEEFLRCGTTGPGNGTYITVSPITLRYLDP